MTLGRIAGTIVAALIATPAAAFECHVSLVLALDASDSVDPAEADLQRGGLAAALTDPAVMAALAPSEDYGSYVMVFEWAGVGDQQIVADWTRLHDEASIRAFASRMTRWPVVYMKGQTAIGDALEFAAKAQDRVPQLCARQVIDVSGDGPGNIGPSPGLHRRLGLFDGITINGLVIRQDPTDYSQQQPSRDPLPYYEAEVRHGVGAFVMVTNSYETYGEAMQRKLLRELRPSFVELAR
ncbi:MAG: DUF1194 domain-containing protein [Pseudomonadota bacterium]